MQLAEGMAELKDVEGAVAKKYLGGGFGGYALYLFGSRDARDSACGEAGGADVVRVEPYLKG